MATSGKQTCHGSLWRTKGPMTDHLLREDSGYELLYTKQLNQEQYEGPVGRKAAEGGGAGGGCGTGECQALCTPVVYIPNLAYHKLYLDQHTVKNDHIEERGPFLLPLSQGQSAMAGLCSVIQVEARQGALCPGGQHGDV
ncbi:hypothetical protein NQZ68_013078 [Dissostichus eleginoides]|nr:hypothetical protein NQZ68_013078 [Dissostichus eleginoides]